MPRGGPREGAGRRPGSNGANRRLFLFLIAAMRDEDLEDGKRLIAAQALAEALLPVGLRLNHTESNTGQRGLFAAAAARLLEGDQRRQGDSFQ